MNLRQFLIFIFVFVLTAIIFGTSIMAQTASRPTADSIYIHANIYTGVIGQSSFHEVQRAEAIAVRGDKVLAVGTESEVVKLNGPETKVVDLKGRFVMPGFNDAHMHLTAAGIKKLTGDLT